MRDKAYIKACLEEALRWIDEKDDALERSRNMGLWFWDGHNAEVMSFVEHPRYAPDALDVPSDEVRPYMVFLVPLTAEQRADLKQSMELDDN